MESFIKDFNADVFTEDVMKARLPEEIFKEYNRILRAEYLINDQ